jgi:GT2 family glycosyltransferase
MLSPSVIVPNLNGVAFLGVCFDALRRQTCPPLETILVDDGSTDASIDLVVARYPEVRVVRHPRTRGVAAAFNSGLRAASGDLIVLLNNDTEAEPTWLAELCGALEADPGASSAASKLLLFDRRDVLHSAGDYYGRDGMPGNRGVWRKDEGQFDGLRETFGPCGAAAAFRRSLFDEIGTFDESLGSYLEDVDLSFRARLRGQRCRFVPTARVYHRLSATGGGKTSSYYVGRNAVWVAAQNLPAPLLRAYLPRLVARQATIAAEALRHGREAAARARLRGQLDGVRGLPSRLGRRRAIQKTRRIGSEELDRMLGE